MASIGANAAERQNWNAVAGPKWIRLEALLEAQHAAIGALLLDEANVRAGERVLEVGCGTGTLLGKLAAEVGGGGMVAGVDISTTMLALARARAPAGVRVFEADAQTDALGGPYDVLVSRFGVMFFDDPVAALANLRAALRPGGRLCFVCWAALALNPHWRESLAVVARHVGAPEPRDASAPGPFAFADPDRVRALLAAAGFGAVSLRTEQPVLGSVCAADAVEIAMRMGPGGALIGEQAPDADTLAAIRAELLAAWQPQRATVHVVTARTEGTGAAGAG
jgi:SAM-dependent methyltransferase